MTWSDSDKWNVELLGEGLVNVRQQCGFLTRVYGDGAGKWKRKMGNKAWVERCQRKMCGIRRKQMEGNKKDEKKDMAVASIFRPAESENIGNHGTDAFSNHSENFYLKYHLHISTSTYPYMERDD